jgi:hypothetical protein
MTMPAKSPRPASDQNVWRLAFFLVLAVAVYLSWKPAPGIKQVEWIPSRFGSWFDDNDGWKNFIGFGLVALTFLMAWREPSGHPNPTRVPGKISGELRLLAGFCGLVALLEIGQLVLPKRTCDWRDVLAGWLGGLVPWTILYAYRSVRAFLAKL